MNQQHIERIAEYLHESETRFTLMQDWLDSASKELLEAINDNQDQEWVSVYAEIERAIQHLRNSAKSLSDAWQQPIIQSFLTGHREQQ